MAILIIRWAATSQIPNRTLGGFELSLSPQVMRGLSDPLVRKVSMFIIRRYLRNRTGQGLIEYMLIISLIAIALIVGLTFFGGSVTNQYNTTTNSVASTLSQ